MGNFEKYTESQLHELHEHEKVILKEFIRVCEKHGLKYFCDWGTLLGVVRHGGFIPWDDDVDVCMLREDYEKFLKIAAEELEEDLVLQHYSVDKRTPCYWAKIRMNGTAFVEAYVKDMPIHKGIYIDVFPVDTVPENENELRKHKRRMFVLYQMFIAKEVKRPTYSYEPKISAKIVRFLMHLAMKPFRKDWLFNFLDRELKKYNHEERKLLMCGDLGFTEIKADLVVPFAELNFENIKVSVPCDYKAVLDAEYGDWNELPPIEKRLGHRPLVLSFRHQPQ